MYLDILEPVLLVVGFLVFLASLILYINRTKDVKSVLMVWKSAIAFTHREFVINRIGITIMFMGLVLRIFNSWAAA